MQVRLLSRQDRRQMSMFLYIQFIDSNSRLYGLYEHESNTKSICILRCTAKAVAHTRKQD